eukprot:gene32015-38711_t
MDDNRTWKHSVKQGSGESREEYLERLVVVAEIRGALLNMMDKYFLRSIGDLDVRFPSTPIDAEVIAWVCDEVSRLKSERTVEASGTINVSNSIHRFWGSLLPKLRRTDGAMCTRIVYEWSILHPFSGKAEAIDFAFIPFTQSHCNWIDFMGGLELKNNPHPSATGASSNAGGLMASDGLAQALRRCAISVYMKWRATGFSGTHCAFCCFADARKFGVVRVRVDDKDVVAQKWGPVNLPGYPSSAPLLVAPDISSLQFLSFVLNSPPEALTDLVSHAPPVADLLEGREEGVGDSEWRLGAFLGKGGFAAVFADANDPYGSVIKLTNADMLNAECRALTLLSKLYPSGTGTLFPALCGRMTDRSTSPAPIAVRLSPRGIPLPVYLASVDCDSSVLTMLARRLGANILTLLRAAHVTHPPDVDVSSTQTADSSTDANKDVSVTRTGMSRHGVAHCDVRLPNILMLPPEGALQNVADAGDDIVSGRAAVMEIPLDQCTFLLNDWGNSKVLNVSNRTLHSVEDLLGLVRVLEQLGWAHDMSIVSPKREEPLSMVMREGSPVLAAETVRQLQSAAKTMNYDELRRLISDLSFASL